MHIYAYINNKLLFIIELVFNLRKTKFLTERHQQPRFNLKFRFVLFKTGRYAQPPPKAPGFSLPTLLFLQQFV